MFGIGFAECMPPTRHCILLRVRYLWLLPSVILVLRTYAIYESSPRILAFLLFLWVCWAGGSLYAISMFTKSLVCKVSVTGIVNMTTLLLNLHTVEYPPVELDGLVTGCYMVDARPVVFGAFAGMLLLELGDF
ncbi:hypothetical protein PUNSTDRAFT_44668 [Punctularia strigosozonata HHB-11173 SS5]|uniref:uncharacterized protein n=1 Tax=Punctularia strigosozonata (strain HHB-11173) TaxID=741275 RepID=UPI00044162DF|nr:uncharacterized protein PUNSTDRAFT_44668 [Punctularia strigosozonata HHB-11173 SS5]EIN09285.1 hypothetical protein PUNSTDRAFT_44668 [Punctularia strigosozonata HHB-11173 SS5]